MSQQATIRSFVGLLHDLTDEEVWELTLSDHRPRLKEFLRTCCEQRIIATAYEVKVDFTKSLADMIAAGRYDRFDNEITADHFLVTGQGTATVEIRLVRLDELVRLYKVTSIKEALEGLGRLNLRPATLPELLALGAAYPDLQRQFSILEFGSIWTQKPVRVWAEDRDYLSWVPCLVGDDSDRGLNLCECEASHEWSGHCRFAAVSK